MILLLCHLVGDYVLQSHVMATRKTSSMFWALVHATFYTLPFAVLVLALGHANTRGALALFYILTTHALIDRFAIAARWCRFYGTGCEGAIVAWRRRHTGYVLGEVLVKPDASETRWIPRAVVQAFDDVAEEEGFDAAHAWVLAHSVPVVASPPPFLGVWLTIIVDNTFHLVINAAAIYLATGWIG